VTSGNHSFFTKIEKGKRRKDDRLSMNDEGKDRGDLRDRRDRRDFRDLRDLREGGDEKGMG
jgi:hypothetical protein